MFEDSNEVKLLPGEQERIHAALEALEEDPHAPRQLTVRVALHVHREYPKHVGGKLVNSRKEEREVREAIALAEKAPAEQAEAPAPASE